MKTIPDTHPNIIKILKQAPELNISDIHICSNEPICIRIDGKLKKIDEQFTTTEELINFLQLHLPQLKINWLENIAEIDTALEIENIARFRVNIFKKLGSLALSLRTINSKPPSLQDIQAPQIFFELTQKTKGLILVTGATGCGKSTTLAAMLNTINETQNGHILTIEDPIEYIHPSKNCLVSQRELYTHTASFNLALKAALREDPDYILIGEMRDLETIQLALTAAETGHLVFATLHTLNAIKTIDRIIDSFPVAGQNQVRSMLAESLTAIITQTLCLKPQGGRVAAFEILIATPAIRNLIREGKIHLIQNCLQTGQALGMQTMEMGLQKIKF
ncbi:MAG: PilT/PilU family type 4a pilus ATPase [Deltaproteobacteria bacterium]|jgi:twitching motility protein PilT|nr:PilT/PilU family type 4a pilus ATPase [Deltaproteobacteria bacterium]